MASNQRPKIHPSTQRQFPASNRVRAGKNKALITRFNKKARGDIFLLFSADKVMPSFSGIFDAQPDQNHSRLARVARTPTHDGDYRIAIF